MSAKKRTTVAVAVLVAATVLFIVAILVLALILPDSDGGPQTVDNGMVFTDMTVDVEWKNDRSCKIEQNLSVEFRQASHGIYIDIPVNSGEKIRNLEVKTQPERDVELSRESGFNIVRARVGDEDRLFFAGDVLHCTVTYDYYTPVHPTDKDVLALNAIGGGWTARVKSATVNMTYPAAPEAGSEYGMWLAGKRITGEEDNISVLWSDGGKKVTIKIDPGDSGYALDAFQNVELAYKMPSGTLVARSDNEFWVPLTAGLILLAAAVVLKIVTKNKALTPIAEFYPPYTKAENGEDKRMLPVQLGKIIDGSCSVDDVTSLVFYWASKGFIMIDEREDDTYFIKLRDVDPVTDYEKKMFDGLFKKGVETGGNIEVSLKSLEGKFGNYVSKTKSSVDREYVGKLYDRKYLVFAVLFGLAVLAYGICIAAVTSLRLGAMMYLPGLVVAILASAATAAVGGILVIYYQKLSKSKSNLFTALYVLGCLALATVVAVVVPPDILGLTEKIIFVLCYGLSLSVVPFIVRRTDFYNEQLNNILGFRDFLRDAEKERLELLLQDDPQYYYDILPYANVLGVSDIWADKFEGITIEPPTYYRSYRGVSVFDIIVINRLMNSVGTTLSYVPPKASGGSFSGGGHGGGGGFSGGSFGGGGGGRW